MGDKYAIIEIRDGTNSFSCHHIEILCGIIKTKQTAVKNKRAFKITSKSWTSLTCFPRIEIPLISRISSPSLRRPLRSAAPPFTTRLTTTLSMSLRTVAPWWPRTDTHKVCTDGITRKRPYTEQRQKSEDTRRGTGVDTKKCHHHCHFQFFPIGYVTLRLTGTHSPPQFECNNPSNSILISRETRVKGNHMWELGQVVNDDYVLVHEDMA